MIPITILTGFLGSGKTTVLLNLIPQLPRDYKLALLKNEFGDQAVDSKLASAAAISGVQELLNGCVCCNLVGQLGDALDTLRQDVRPDRIVVETSGSAFPATLAMEINRLARKTGHYALDGVISVIDVENWKGYEDTSYTARMQARFTDVIVFNKWELVGERRYEECLDRIGDLDVPVATVKSDKGSVPMRILLGIDSSLAKLLPPANESTHAEHDHAKGHESEVEVLSLSYSPPEATNLTIDVTSFEDYLSCAPKDEVYRIKGLATLASAPSPDHVVGAGEHPAGTCRQYILNFAFDRWTFTRLAEADATGEGKDADSSSNGEELRLTIITAREMSEKVKKQLSLGAFIGARKDENLQWLDIRRTL